MIKSILKKCVCRRIALRYGHCDQATLNRYADFVTCAPLLQWPFRLKLIQIYGGLPPANLEALLKFAGY